MSNQKAQEKDTKKTQGEGSNGSEKDSEAQIYFGVQVEINDRTVDLMPKTPINKIDEQGFELELAKPLEIGTLGEAMYKIATQDFNMKEESTQYFKKENPKSTGIDALDGVIKTALQAKVTVQALHYKQYPKSLEAPYFETHSSEKEKAGKTDYLFAASASCKDPKKEGDFFKFNGLFVIIAKGIKQERVTQVLEESIKGIQAALPAGKDEETQGAITESKNPDTSSKNK